MTWQMKLQMAAEQQSMHSSTEVPTSPLSLCACMTPAACVTSPALSLQTTCLKASPILGPPFPLILAYAMTVHKCQGDTMDYVLVDIADPFSPGLLYVALSRVRSRATLRILHRPLASQCTPVPRLRPPDPSRRHLASTLPLGSPINPSPHGLEA